MTWVNCPFKGIQETHAPGPCHVHEIVSCQGSEKRKMQMNGIIISNNNLWQSPPKQVTSLLTHTQTWPNHLKFLLWQQNL